MKVLYIKRDDWIRGIKKNKYSKILKSYLKRNVLMGQGGFFEAAVYSTFEVTEISYHKIKYLPLKFLKGQFDFIIVNEKSIIDLHETKALSQIFSETPKIYFASSARIQLLPSNDILDNYDIVFKREPYKDLERYINLSYDNIKKIKPTILACPLIKIKKNQAKNYTIIDSKKFDNYEINPPNYEVSFVGSGTSELRYHVCNKVNSIKSWDTFLSIYERHKRSVPKFVSSDIKSVKLSLDEYVNLIRKTSVNLALEGIGQFTHRHLELWYLGAFMLSNSSINEIQLPHSNHIENIHYAVFQDFEDLIEKINYYIDNENDRERIAANGKKLFEQIYDFKKHGKFIKECIKAL